MEELPLLLRQFQAILLYQPLRKQLGGKRGRGARHGLGHLQRVDAAVKLGFILLQLPDQRLGCSARHGIVPLLMVPKGLEEGVIKSLLRMMGQNLPGKTLERIPPLVR